MINPLMLEILKKKIDNGEVVVSEIKSDEYKTAIEEYLVNKEATN